jgi:hypothetical protein
MKPFDDVLPEEQEEQHRELITLVHQAYHQFHASTADTQKQAIQRVGERLAMMEDKAALSEETLPGQLEMEQALLREPETVGRRPGRRKRAVHLLNVLAAVLVVGLLIGGSIALFTKRSPSTTAGPVGSPVTVHAEAGGLEMSLSMTPGPYFLSELILANMSLINHSHTTFMLREGLCFPALRLEQTGGESPHYTLPLHGNVVFLGCNEHEGSLEPGQTITDQQYELLTSSGQVTLTATAKFVKDVVRKMIKPGFGPVDVHGDTPISNPLGHWPSLQIQVASHIPSDRLFSLHLQGSQVHINAPPYLHLVYRFIESCVGDGLSIDVGSLTWGPISTRVLNVPGNLVGCPAKDVRWQYAVSAAGYAIVGGNYPA